MRMSIAKTTVAATACCLLTAMNTNIAIAAGMTYMFTSTATSGPLKGSVATGTFTFDSGSIPSRLPGSNTTTGLLTALSFSWNGVTYNSTTANTGRLSFDNAGKLSFGTLFGTQCVAGSCSVSGSGENWYVQIGGGIGGAAGFVYSLPGGAVGNGTTVLNGPFISSTYVFRSIDYQIVNKQIVPGGTFTQMVGINNRGVIPLEIVDRDTNLAVALLYEGGTFVPLPVAPGVEIAPTGINDAGVVVGSATTIPYTVETGFILTNGIYRFFVQPSFDNNEPRGINTAGLVVGFSYPQDALTATAYIFDPSSSTYTSFTVPGAPVTIATGINDAGQAVGNSYASVFGSHQWADPSAFLRQPNGALQSFRINGRPTAARGINNKGLITGWVRDTMGLSQPFVADSSGYQLLSCPANICPNPVDVGGEAINDDGLIVGTWFDAAGGIHGFIATPASLPTGTNSNGAYTFNVDVVPNVMIFIDPGVSLGFDYAIGDGDPKIASVQLPIGIGDSQCTLLVHGQSFAVAGGQTFDLAAHGFPNGVAHFRVADIEASASLSPNNPAAFPTGLTFMSAGTFTGTMTPLCAGASLAAQAKAPIGRPLVPCL